MIARWWSYAIPWWSGEDTNTIWVMSMGRLHISILFFGTVAPPVDNVRNKRYYKWGSGAVPLRCNLRYRQGVGLESGPGGWWWWWGVKWTTRWDPSSSFCGPLSIITISISFNFVSHVLSNLVSRSCLDYGPRSWVASGRLQQVIIPVHELNDSLPLGTMEIQRWIRATQWMWAGIWVIIPGRMTIKCKTSVLSGGGR